MVKAFIATAALAMTTTALMAGTQTANIGKTDAKTLGTELMTPEALWAMGRISAAAPSPDGKTVVYQVGYYSVKENRSHHVLYIINTDGSGKTHDIVISPEQVLLDGEKYDGKGIPYN